MTRIRFDVHEEGAVSLRIYDAAGRRVRTLVDERLARSAHARVWDGRDERGAPAASGIYFVRLVAARTTLVHKLVLLR